MPVSGGNMYLLLGAQDLPLPETPETEGREKEMALSAEETAEAEREAARRGARTEEVLDTRADAVNAVRELLKNAGSERAKIRLAKLVLEFVSQLSDQVDIRPDAVRAAMSVEELLDVASGTRRGAAVLTTGSEPDSGDTDTSDDDVLRRAQAVLDVIADLASRFRYTDSVGFLTSGPVNMLSQIADRGGDAPRAITELLRLVLSATNPASANALQADGTLMVHDMYDRAERERAQLARNWKVFIDELDGLAPDVLRTRRANMVAAAKGEVHPDLAAKNTEISGLNDQITELTRQRDEALRRVAMWEGFMTSLGNRREDVLVTSSRAGRTVSANVIVVTGGEGVVTSRPQPLRTDIFTDPSSVRTVTP